MATFRTPLTVNIGFSQGSTWMKWIRNHQNVHLEDVIVKGEIDWFIRRLPSTWDEARLQRVFSIVCSPLDFIAVSNTVLFQLELIIDDARLRVPCCFEHKLSVNKTWVLRSIDIIIFGTSIITTVFIGNGAAHDLLRESLTPEAGWHTETLWFSTGMTSW